MKYYKVKLELLIEAPDEVSANSDIGKRLNPSMNLINYDASIPEVIDFEIKGDWKEVSRPEKLKTTPYKFLEFLKWK